MSRAALRARSLDVLRDAQTESGAIIASRAFSQYDYCWFRDSAFVAHALLVCGEHERAGRFHRWAAGVVAREADTISRAIADRYAGRPVDAGDILDTRFRADGTRGDEPWPNFQLDGLGAWLWSLREWARAGHDRPAGRLATSIGLAGDYLAALWDQPSYDCWEENAGQVHVSTLAAVYAGLVAASELLGSPTFGDVAGQARELALGPGVVDGRLRKHLGSELADGSLIWAGVPFGLLSPADPVMTATAQAIAADLTGPTGGIYRYLGDTYYGGGEWIPLAAHLGWYWAKAGQAEAARTLLTWVESAATSEGLLPEQTLDAVQRPPYVETWTRRWGTVATPLTWSHAAYLILDHELSECQPETP
ncbi:MAG TPA: glycoside hydrolase family 15 protein [Streptosporangiaceae bacterium]|nr:glycoside hydrolase family 15 protein [Streptosporangiaceae bacterium]